MVLEQLGDWLGERLGETEKNLELIAGDKGIYITAMVGKFGIGTTAVENNLKSLKSKGTNTHTGPLRNQTYVAITRARERL